MGLFQIAVDYLISKKVGGSITSQSKIQLLPRVEVEDFSDDDYITKYFYESVSGLGIPPALIHYPAGSPLGLTIDNLDTFPQFGSFFGVIIGIVNDGFFTPIYDMPPHFQYDPDLFPGILSITSVVIDGHDDPDNPGQTIDDVYIIFTK